MENLTFEQLPTAVTLLTEKVSELTRLLTQQQAQTPTNSQPERLLTIEEAAKLGSACGSLVATGLGSDAGIIDLDSTLEFSKTNPTLPLGD